MSSWDYPATIWVLDPDNSEGWLSYSGVLIYNDGMIGRVRDKDNIIREAPLHCIYVQVPMSWFLSATYGARPSSGRYGSDYPTISRSSSRESKGVPSSGISRPNQSVKKSKEEVADELFE